jgi:PIN domain nuclease of toxin-antitoxin system
VKLLLDTHAFIWRVTGSKRLSSVASAAIDDPSNQVLVSAASAWEVATKHRLGKLPEGAAIVAGFIQVTRTLHADFLSMSVEHSLLAGSFDVSHRDPFDRMLAAQAAVEGAQLVTLDPAFAEFPIATYW